MKKQIPIYKQWWFWVIIGIVAIASIGGAGASQNSDSPKNEDTNTENQIIDDTTDSNLFVEYEMEEFCQEDHLVDIQGYFNSIGRNVSIISITNYNKYFNADYTKTPDDAQKPIALLSWNGKDKDTGQIVSFSCWATKTNGEKKLLLLDIDNQTVRGSMANIFGPEE